MSRLDRETWSDTTYPQAPGYVRHSETSKQAADSIKPKLGDLHRKVWKHIRDCEHGCTDEEGREALNLGENTYRPRRVELAARGYVIDSGGTRKTRSGRNAVVWLAVRRSRPSSSEGL